MRYLPFSKLHGAGNDYIYVDLVDDALRAVPESEWPRISELVSHRTFGVGADGLILISPSETADAGMRIFNADGSEAEMCGNGIRSVAKFLFDKGRIGASARIETKAGLIGVEVKARSGEVPTRVRVDMGNPRFAPEEIPTTLTARAVPYQGPAAPAKAVFREKLDVDGRSFEVTCVSMGNPHCVIFVDDADNFPVTEIGPKIEKHPVFPRRANVEFVSILGKGRLRQRTWERGSGETWACGTGASAVLVAATLNGHADRAAEIRLTGGLLEIEWSPEGRVYMTGPSVFVCEGRIDLDELRTRR